MTSPVPEFRGDETKAAVATVFADDDASAVGRGDDPISSSRMNNGRENFMTEKKTDAILLSRAFFLRICKYDLFG